MSQTAVPLDDVVDLNQPPPAHAEEVSKKRASKKFQKEKLARPTPGENPVFFKTSFEPKRELKLATLNFDDFFSFGATTRDIIGAKGTRVIQEPKPAYHVAFAKSILLALINQLAKAAVEDGNNNPFIVEASKLDVDLPATYVQAASVVGIAECYGQAYVPSNPEATIARLIISLSGDVFLSMPPSVSQIDYDKKSQKLFVIEQNADENTFGQVLQLCGNRVVGPNRIPVDALLPYPRENEKLSAYVDRVAAHHNFSHFGISKPALDALKPALIKEASTLVEFYGQAPHWIGLCKHLSIFVVAYATSVLPQVLSVCKVLNTKKLTGFGTPAMFCKLALDTIVSGVPLAPKYVTPGIVFAPFRSKMLKRFVWPAPIYKRSEYAVKLATTVLKLPPKKD